MSIRRTIAAIAVTVLATFATVTAAAAPAQADTATSNACTRAGYSNTTRTGPYYAQSPNNDAPGGHAYVYYGSGRNCAVFLSGGTTTMTSYIRVCIERRSDLAKVCDPPVNGPGPYHSYAGPVVISAANTCVRLTGAVKLTDSRYADPLSTGWIRCG